MIDSAFIGNLVGSPSGNNLTPAGPCRYDSSLGNLGFCQKIKRQNEAHKLHHFHFFCISLPGLLTKKFINLIKRAEDGVLDLNKAAETLEVSL